jgi:hypothetical protein
MKGFVGGLVGVVGLILYLGAVLFLVALVMFWTKIGVAELLASAAVFGVLALAVLVGRRISRHLPLWHHEGFQSWDPDMGRRR